MSTLVLLTLDVLRRWLDKMGVAFFECDSCQALHLPHMQNFEGISDAKIDLIDNVLMFSALAEVRPSALLALSAELSEINGQSLMVKAFLDVQDDNLPRLVVCQTLPAHAGVTYDQFCWFYRHSEEQVSMVMLEAKAQQFLYSSDERSDGVSSSQPQYLH